MIRSGSIGIVIDNFTFAPWEHVIEKCTGDGHHTYNLIGDGLITEALLKKGVVKNSILKYQDGKSISVILEPKGRVFSDAQLATVCAHWESEVGLEYDNGSIIDHWLGWTKLKSLNKRICSEHTARGYYNIGYNFLGKEPGNVTPNDILKHCLYSNFAHFKPRLYSRLIK